MSTVGWKGKGHLALEFPAGRDLSGQVGVAPVGRMRFRYSDVDKRPEVSVDGGPYVPLATGGGVAPQYGELYVVGNLGTLAVNTVTFTLVDAFDTIGAQVGVDGELAPGYSLTPNPTGGDYRVTVNATIVGDVGLGYELAVFLGGVATHIQCASGNAEGTAARVISCDGFLEDVAGALDVRMRSVGGNGDVVVGTAQFTIEKVGS